MLESERRKGKIHKGRKRDLKEGIVKHSLFVLYPPVFTTDSLGGRRRLIDTVILVEVSVVRP